MAEFPYKKIKNLRKKSPSKFQIFYALFCQCVLPKQWYCKVPIVHQMHDRPVQSMCSAREGVQYLWSTPTAPVRYTQQYPWGTPTVPGEVHPQQPWMIFNEWQMNEIPRGYCTPSRVLRVCLNGTAHPHGHCWCAPWVSHILYTAWWWSTLKYNNKQCFSLVCWVYDQRKSLQMPQNLSRNVFLIWETYS